MGRHRHDELDLGFDLSRTRDNLLATLLASGDTDVGKHRLPEEPGPGLPPEERDAALWLRAEAAAMVHAARHGVPGQMRVDKGEWQALPACERDCCRVAGLSFALLELSEYWRDRDRADYRICIAEIHAHASNLDTTVLAALERASSKLMQQMRQQRQGVLARAAAMEEAGNRNGAEELRQAQANADKLLKGQRTRLILGRWLGRALVRIAELAGALHRSLEGEGSPHRPLPTEISAGRPKASLLNAVLQHLKRGGMERREMMEIIAGMTGGGASTTPAAVKSQIRDRLRSEDCRTIGPMQPTDGLRPGKGKVGRPVSDGPSPVTVERSAAK